MKLLIHNKWLISSSPATSDLEYFPSLTHFPLSFLLSAAPSPRQALLLLPFRSHLSAGSAVQG